MVSLRSTGFLTPFVRHVYDAARRVCLLDGSGGFSRHEDDLEVAVAPVLFLDAARELPSFEVELEALGDLAAGETTRSVQQTNTPGGVMKVAYKG